MFSESGGNVIMYLPKLINFVEKYPIKRGRRQKQTSTQYLCNFIIQTAERVDEERKKTVTKEERDSAEIQKDTHS